MKAISLSNLQAEIRSIQAQLQSLGPMHPGSISKQYQVCGRAGCRCADPEHPQRHGPYHKLAYVYRGKPICRFVRAGTEQVIAQRLAVYKQFRQLISRWIALSIQSGIIEFFPAACAAPRTNKRTSKPRRSPRA